MTLMAPDCDLLVVYCFLLSPVNQEYLLASPAVRSATQKASCNSVYSSSRQLCYTPRCARKERSIIFEGTVEEGTAGGAGGKVLARALARPAELVARTVWLGGPTPRKTTSDWFAVHSTNRNCSRTSTPTDAMHKNHIMG